MIGQHDAARSDTDGRRRIADMRENHGCRPARDAFHGVVFGHPETLATHFFRRSGKRRGGVERLSQCAALADRDEVENGKIGHGFSCSR